MEKLHPGARWQFRISGYVLFGVLGIFFGFWMVFPVLTFVFSNFDFSSSSTAVIVVLSVLAYLLFVLLISEIYARMAYNRWFYELNEDGLRLERGIIWKRYSNVPYERIQNVDVHRGVIARILGFSSLMIQTAGYSTHPYAEGYIPALEMKLAEQIRNSVMKKITGRKK